MAAPLVVGGRTLGSAHALADGQVLAHTFAFLHHRTSRTYHVAWAEPTREGPSRILYSTSRGLFSGWQTARELDALEAPVEGLQLTASGGQETPRLFLSYRPLLSGGARRPLSMLFSEDGGKTWDGPHVVREEEPLVVGGTIPGLEPSGGPGTEHLLHTFMPSHSHDVSTPRPPAWALVASDRFIEWSLGLRPFNTSMARPEAPGDTWGPTVYLGIRHHMPLPAYLAEDAQQGLCVVYLKSPTDYRKDDMRPGFPQAWIVRLDLPAIIADRDDDGQTDLEDYLLSRYHSQDQYRLWMQCRVDSREAQRKPFVCGVRKVLKLSKGVVLEAPRPMLRAGQGVPRTVLLLGRGASLSATIQEVQGTRQPAYMLDRGKDRYPESQGFTIRTEDTDPRDLKPGLAMVPPGLGHTYRSFTAEVEVLPDAALPEKALFQFWTYNFPGAVVESSEPNDDGTVRVRIELDEDVFLEPGLRFPMLVPDSGITIPDRSPEAIGFDDDDGSMLRLIGLGTVSELPEAKAATGVLL